MLLLSGVNLLQFSVLDLIAEAASDNVKDFLHVVLRFPIYNLPGYKIANIMACKILDLPGSPHNFTIYYGLFENMQASTP